MAEAHRRRQERDIEEWKGQQHTVMEVVGDEPTGLIIEMPGNEIIRKNSEMLVMYLAEIGNWNSYGDDPKPRLRKFVTPREFRIRKFNGRKITPATTHDHLK